MKKTSRTARDRHKENAVESEDEGGFWPFLGKLFSSRNDDGIEEAILDAKEEGELKTDESAMLLNVLRLGRKQVQEISIPRTDIVCAEVDSTIEEIAQILIKSGHSRLPIYRDNRDNIVGIIHAKDLLRSILDPARKAETVESLMRKTFFIPETKNVKDLLQEFRAKKIHLAIALDEYGGTSGLVTIEDVLEEIVGEIEDEYDAPRPEDIQILGDNELLVSGRTMLSEIKEQMDLELVSEQVETIGGYLCEVAGRVPETGETFTLGGHRFTIKEADAKQIRWIVLHPPEGFVTKFTPEPDADHEEPV